MTEDAWTRERIEAEGPITDVPTTAAILRASAWSVYEEIRRGTWTLTRVLRIGRKIKIPTHDLIALLYAPDKRTAGTQPPADATTSETTTRSDFDDDSTRPRPRPAVAPSGR